MHMAGVHGASNAHECCLIGVLSCEMSICSSSTPSEPAFPGPAGGKYLEVGDTLFVKRDTCGTPLRK